MKVEINTNEIQAEVVTAIDHASNFTDFHIDSDEGFMWAQEATKAVSDKLKEIEDRRKLITKPMLDAKKEVDKLFKEVAQPYKDADAYLRKELIRYEGVKALAREAAHEEAKKAVVLDKSPEEVKTLLAQSVESTPVIKGVGFKDVWTWACQDFAKLPDEFKKIDETALNAYVRKNKGNSDIPGVTITKEKKVRA